jgi:hypothetical protein
VWTSDSRTTRHHRLIILTRFSRPHPSHRGTSRDPPTTLLTNIDSGLRDTLSNFLVSYLELLATFQRPILALASIALANPHVAHPRRFRFRLGPYHQFATLPQLSRADIRSESSTLAPHSL